MSVSRPKLVSILIVLLIILSMAAPVAAISKPVPEVELTKLDSLRLMQAMERRAAVGQEQALESNVDPKEYIVGPGDELILSLWGEISESYPVEVTPEGKALIPHVGEILVGELTLEEAEKKILQAVGRRYKSVQSSVSLSKVRKFRVFVVGTVNVPGTYTATAVDRVSMLIDQAGGFAPGASSRNISVKRENAEDIAADLQSFINMGKLDDNPYVRDGDVIAVPVRLDSVGIFGAISIEGYYELKEGDRISDLVELAGGPVKHASFENAELVRYLEDGKTTTRIFVDFRKAFVERDPEHDHSLQSDDVFLVRHMPSWHPDHLVEVTGQVYYPGHYSIERDKTYLSEIIERAGGFKPDASLTEAKLVRTLYEDILDPEYERLSRMLVADMSEEEYEYFKTKSRQQWGLVVVDFEKLFLSDDKSQDVLLKRGDFIEIPAVRKTIDVSGQVNDPGAVMFRPGKDLDYYIDQAGGYNWNARKGRVRVIKGSSGQWLKPGKVKRLEPGDTIFVPEKPERDYWGLFKDFIGVSAQIATVILVIQQATK
jgi:protein involved in polysaccharide export with SLBB domain